MQYEIKDDRLWLDGRPASFIASPNFGGRIEPTLIVLHDTADRPKPNDTVNWFKNPKSKVSAHFVVERNGSIVQMVECDRRAWHCDPSEWKGRKGCNGFSIGIEIDNPGHLAPKGEQGIAWFGEGYSLTDCVITDKSCRTHGAGAWLHYTEAQIQAVEALVAALSAAYPSITDVAGHFEVSPKRKVDPGPHFPIDQMRDALGERAVPHPATVREFQGELAELGYPVGDIDGLIGTRTRSAIRAFQEQNKLEVTGKFDAATVTAIKSGVAKEMPLGHREGITKDDLKADGSSTIARTQLQKRAVEGAGVVATVLLTTADEAQAPAVSIEALPDPETLIAAGEKHRALGERAVDLISWLGTPKGLVTMGIIIALIAIWAAANRQEVGRVLRARLGMST